MYLSAVTMYLSAVIMYLSAVIMYLSAESPLKNLCKLLIINNVQKGQKTEYLLILFKSI